MVASFLPDNLPGLIQSMVTPAVMISACGLLLLSLTNKLGRIIDRIRDLNAEDRAMTEDNTSVRRVSVRTQIDQLVRRAVLVRGACGLLFIAVSVFVVTSLCIGLSALGRVFTVLMLTSFVAGLVFVVWACVLAYMEMRASHQVVVEEIRELRLHD
jgi:hypothetical protein